MDAHSPRNSDAATLAAAAPITSRPTAPGRISTPSTAACATCCALYLTPDDFGGSSRISIASARSPAAGSTNWRGSPTSIRRSLHPRDRFGRDEDWIDYHASYREMEQIAFGDFQFHAMSHRAGALGMDRPLPAVAKYALQYLFVQAEFGLMCPISVTDTSIHLIRKFASAELQEYLLPKMLSGDVATMWKGTQFMTERAGGSDVGAIETTARAARTASGGCTATNGSARMPTPTSRCCWRGPEGAPAGTKGLALFALPRRLKDGSRNAYRIVRLKDKLGTRSMASGEILLEGAVAYLVGDAEPGPQADDGAGQPVAAVAWRARGGDDAALRQRGDGLRADAHGVRQDHHRLSAAAPPAAEDHGADGAVAVDVPVRGRARWTAPMPARRTPKASCAS